MPILDPATTSHNEDTMQQLQNGPFIYAIGCVGRPDFKVQTAVIPGQSLNSLMNVADDGTITTIDPLTIEERRSSLPRDVYKASGVARARNCGKSTIFAALVAQEFNRMLAEKPDYDSNRIVVAICNSSSSGAISWEYENEGVTLGWRNTNTMLMPSALPSAIGTQISAAIQAHNATITFLNDIVGMCAALEYTHVNFFHERADYSFVIAAEELTLPHVKIIEREGADLLVQRDGASGVLFSRHRPFDTAWQLCLYAHVAEENDVVIPDDWNDAKVLKISLPEYLTAHSSLVFPFALQTICTQSGKKGIVIITVENRSTFAFGFQLTGEK